MTDSIKINVQKVKPSAAKPERIVPKDIQGQLAIIFGNAKFEMEYIPNWLKLFGVGKLKAQLTNMIDSPSFRKEMQTIFESAREKHKAHENKPELDVIQLLKKRDVFDQVFNCMQANTKEKSLLNTVMKFDYVKDRYYNMVITGSPNDLLYKVYEHKK